MRNSAILIEMFATKSVLLHMKVYRSLIDSLRSAFKFKLEGGISVSEQFTYISFCRVENCNGKKIKPGHAGLGGLLFFLSEGLLYFQHSFFSHALRYDQLSVYIDCYSEAESPQVYEQAVIYFSSL